MSVSETEVAAACRELRDMENIPSGRVRVNKMRLDAAARLEALAAEVVWLRAGNGRILATHTQIMDMVAMTKRAERAEAECERISNALEKLCAWMDNYDRVGPNELPERLRKQARVALAERGKP